MEGGRSVPIESGCGLVILVPRAGGDGGSKRGSHLRPVTAPVPELLSFLGETECPASRDENVH